MFLAASNKVKRLLHLSYIQHVQPEELKRGGEDIKTLLADLPPGFRLLADFGRLESIDLACTTEIGRMMELFDQSGVGLVVRVIPDASKDIGMDILTLFHYRHHPHVVNCENMVEAAKELSL
jgi:hypothetical protein